MITYKVVGLRVPGPRRTFRYCLECALKKYKAESAAQLERLAGNRIMGNVLYANDDSELFGKICVSCKTPLAAWIECRYCHSIFWTDNESHTCEGLWAAEERMLKKYGDNWDGNLDWQVTSWKRSPIPN